MPVMASARFVSGGYFIARKLERDDQAMGVDLLPPRILSASSCLCDTVPDVWSIGWSEVSRDAQRATAAHFGLDDAALDRVIEWTTSALDDGRAGWPNVLFTLRDARDFAARFLDASAAVTLFGLALPDDLAREFAVDARPKSATEGPMGLWQAIERGDPPAPGGTVLGFEVLGYDRGFHSFVCNGLERVFRDALQIVPNANGLYENEHEARRCADHAMRPDVGAEPGLWLPWQMTRYEISSGNSG